MSDHPVKRRKKLIEVAIPLEAINAASAREKSIRHGHPSTLHLWWARRPLAAARAVIFCQMVDDPSAVPEEFPTEEAQENERLRLFALISELVQWENTTNEEVLNRAREEIRRSWRRCCADNADHPEAAELFNPEKLPGFHDPFAGGGALPLEAQRLGLEAYASDLNPVAVLINKAMIEIPPKFAGMPPVNPEARSKKQLIERQWKGAEGLAEDVRYYGKWMRDEAEKRIGHLYPKVEITDEIVEERPDLKPYAGQKLKVVAWLWVRTVKSPNPAFSDVDVPLASSFLLTPMAGKEAYVEPIITPRGYQFQIRVGVPGSFDEIRTGTKLGRGGNFRCLMSGTPIDGNYIKAAGNAGQMGARLMAVVAEGNRERVYLAPTPEMESAPLMAQPCWRPEGEIAKRMTGGNCTPYGLTTWGNLFTDRQLVALTTFADLMQLAHEQTLADALAAGLGSEPVQLCEGGSGARAYADAVSTYLAFLIGKLADKGSTLCTWDAGPASNRTASGRSARVATVRVTFGRQALPMTWDYAEVNLFSDSVGSLETVLKTLSAPLEYLPQAASAGEALQSDAQSQKLGKQKIVSTDPPYYDNIGYADLSDFFYVWLRRSLKAVFPTLFTTLAVPKAEELVATPYRHGGKENAEAFFLDGMTLAMQQIAAQSHPAFPVTIYYAFKQSEAKSAGGTASTGWETFLAAVIKAGFALCGTWPIRTELANRMIGAGANALASSVVLVCQRRSDSAPTLSRTEFRRQLRQGLPYALKELERANIAPVDVAQAAIGPGMAIFSSARAVLNPDDSPMSVRDALIEINAALDEYLSQDEGELDADSRFALTFFESFGYEERDFGDAEGLAKARNLSVDGVAKAGILRSVAGKACLLRREQLDDDWDPSQDNRLCVWEATQQLIKRLEAGGETAAGALLAELKQVSGHGDLAANCRALAYRLYNHCEKTKQAEEARSYNGLVIAWPELERQASAASSAQSAPLQTSLI
jgi:putative DNA methylase